MGISMTYTGVNLHARLNGNNMIRREDPDDAGGAIVLLLEIDGRTKFRTQAILPAKSVIAHIMDLKPNKVAQAMREKRLHDARVKDFLQRSALEDAQVHESPGANFICISSDILEIDARFDN